jgi:hypothetical protein
MQQKLVTVGQEHLALQAILIGLPDAIPTRQFRKKKTHGLANARGLTGAEIAAAELKKSEALVRDKDRDRDRRAVTPVAQGDEDTGLVLFTTPPRLAGESQGGTTISLAMRPSPEQPRRRPAPAFFQLFPRDEEQEQEEEQGPALPPASTAPPRLEEEGRVKRRRVHTDKYKDAVA